MRFMANRCQITSARVSAFVFTFVLGLKLTVVWNDVATKSILPFGSKGCEANSTSKACRNTARRVLLDMRYRAERRQLSDEEFRAHGEELVAVNKRVLPDVFPNGYLARSHSECDEVSTKKMADDPRELEWARVHGYFRPRVYKWRGGSFTEPHVGEALYQIVVGECNAQSGRLAYGSIQLAVYRGPMLRASFNTVLGTDVYPISDLNGDGVDELLLARDEHDDCGGFMRFSLVSLKGGELQVLHDFGTVGAHYRWDNSTNNYAIEVAVLSYIPKEDGQQPDFYRDIYRGHCKVTDRRGFPEPDNCWPTPDAWIHVRGSDE
jgi:hypothetical protein